MDKVLGRLKERRDRLIDRGVRMAGTSRDRGIDTLGNLKDGALDWRATLAARRTRLEQHEPRWLAIQLGWLDRFDRVLAAFTDRVRHEIERLQQIELGAGSPAPTIANDNGKPRKKKAKKLTAKGGRKAIQSKPRAAAKASRRLLLPIARYDSLTAKEVLGELDGLTTAQCRTVLAHEKSNKGRKTVIKALTRLAA